MWTRKVAEALRLASRSDNDKSYQLQKKLKAKLVLRWSRRFCKGEF